MRFVNSIATISQPAYLCALAAGFTVSQIVEYFVKNTIINFVYKFNN